MSKKIKKQAKRKQKKVIAKRDITTIKQKEDKAVIKEEMSDLNTQLITFLTDTLKTNQSIDLREPGLLYLNAVNTIKKIDPHTYKNESSTLYNYKTDVVEHTNNQANYYMKACGDSFFTDSYLALCAVYGIKANKNDTGLMSLMDDDFDFNYEKKTEFKYINVNDVVKSKGNSINGPRREDVGKFNRKLFEAYSEEIKKSSATKAVTNLQFFDLAGWKGNEDEIIFSEFVTLQYFKGPEIHQLGEYILIIHKKQDVTYATVTKAEKLLFEYKTHNEFHSYLPKDKKKLGIFFIEEFKIYEIKFLSEHALANAYDNFFQNSVLVPQTKGPYELNDIMSFM